MKPTADRFIKRFTEEFNALPPDEKRRAYATIAQQKNIASSVEGDDFTDSVKHIFLKHINNLLQPTVAVGQKIRWKDILIAFIPNQYVSNYTEIWRLEAVLGSAIVRDTLRKNYILDADFVELLFRQSSYFFYVNQTETWLFSNYADLSEAEGGPLKQLPAFDALQRYGLKLLEEAKRKTIRPPVTARLSSEWMERLGPAVLPFERSQFTRTVEDGEDIIFVDNILSVTDQNSINPVVLPASIILQDQPIAGRYLWIIDEQGLKIIPESTPNPYADRGVVCHTNITGGARALQGGELWFGDDGNVYLNYKSGRYGAQIGLQGAAHRQAVLDFFRSLRFDPIALDNSFV